MYKIGVFDSGVGGLTVLKEIEKKIPDANIIYFGDNANSPYGDKTEEQIKNLCVKIGDFLYKNDVDAIVIACNTATAASLDALRDKFPIPIIGVIEPGMRAALKSTKNGKISVIATPATVKLNAYKNVFKKLAPESYSFFQRGCKLLCPMIEEGWEEKYSNYFRDEIITLYLEQIPEDADTLILGCTHYPMVKQTISEHFRNIIIDPAEETALELLKQLKNVVPKIRKYTGIEYATSGDTNKFREIAEKFLGKHIDNVSNVVL